MMTEPFLEDLCVYCVDSMELICESCGLCLAHCCNCSIETDPADTLPG